MGGTKKSVCTTNLEKGSCQKLSNKTIPFINFLSGFLKFEHKFADMCFILVCIHLLNDPQHPTTCKLKDKHDLTDTGSTISPKLNLGVTSYVRHYGRSYIMLRVVSFQYT